MKSVNERGDTSPQLQNNAAGESKKSPSTDKRGNTSSQNKSGDSSPQNQRGGNPPQKKHGGNPPQKRRHTFRKPGRYKPMSDQKSGTGQQPKLQGAPAPQPTSGKGFPLRMYPLGGFEQVGRNCFVLEVDNDIYIIDLGLQFPDEGMLGIDYLIPDISALRGRENRIKGILFTHGHLDHIGAAQHLLPKLHYPPCYGTKLTMAFIKKRLDEEKITSKANLNVVNYGEKIRLGKVEVEFLKVTHSIPDSAAIAIHTPYGTIVHTGDFKFDLTPMNEPPADFHRLAQQSEKGVLAIIADSTNANRPGHSKSEAEISEALFNLFRDANGRIIISTFSSLLNRLQQIIDHAQKLNRKVFISGRSMETNIEIAQNLGYIKAPRGVIRKVGPGMDKIPDKEVIIMTTGSQGEEMAGLARIGLGTHRHISIKKGDTVILSSSPIIGNERAISKVINNMHLQGATVKTSGELSIHTTGHGHQNDLLLMHRLVRAKHIIPEHGEPYMRSAHAELAKKIGYPDNRIHMLSNGEILEFDVNGNARRSKQKLTIQDVIIDGYGSAGEGKRIMDDRKIMSSNGVIVIALRAYAESKRLVGNPDILARGLIYGSEQEKITSEAIQIAKKAYEESLSRGETERKDLKRAVNGAVFRYFDRKLNRKPMIIPIVIEV
ncbi:RNase J family beta-CASP ribonuclease [Patescibacteria group bacterium]|nr:RNase J family beta-CASP ribonuclease [Patescibacteria group bacterium]MBU1123292.1 RNase J family beta-CASP ribonuclease [Patescibacteria group bacterium]MBU1911691.1 RNase J family beta-CASP ribonuclease [Patescibacteria group bacterium]